MDRGTLVDHDGRPAVRFRREYARPVQRLWAAITEPDELALVPVQRADGAQGWRDDRVLR
jgi:hypothetical protein